MKIGDWEIVLNSSKYKIWSSDDNNECLVEYLDNNNNYIKVAVLFLNSIGLLKISPNSEHCFIINSETKEVFIDVPENYVSSSQNL